MLRSALRISVALLAIGAPLGIVAVLVGAPGVEAAGSSLVLKHAGSITPPTSSSQTSSTTSTSSAAPSTTTTTTASTTTSTTSTTTTTPASQAVSGNISVSGGQLVLDGAPYKFTGVNAYELATSWGTNAGCGQEVSDAQLDQFFASLRPNSLVRIWAFQGTMATNFTTHQLDWGPLDRVFNAATTYGQRLIVVLTGESGSCDNGQWKDPAWYNGGFMDVANGASDTDGQGLTPLSYWDYLQDIVNRYKNSSALGMWEPISEPEASTCPAQDEPSNCSGNQTCPNETAAAQALRHFFDTVGGEIHTLDPNHLVESGMIGSGQCGTAGADYEYVSASPGIDVLSYHDYSDPSTPIPGDQWNGLAVRFSEAAALNKPIIGGEEGIEAGSGSGCLSPAQRASDFAANVEAQLQDGSSGVLAWDWEPSETSPCIYDFTAGDPVLGVLSSIRLS